MDQNNDWIVYRRNDGLWAKKTSGAKNASSVHATLEQAENSAREMLKTRGGGNCLLKVLTETFAAKILFYKQRSKVYSGKGIPVLELWQIYIWVASRVMSLPGSLQSLFIQLNNSRTKQNISQFPN